MLTPSSGREKAVLQQCNIVEKNKMAKIRDGSVIKIHLKTRERLKDAGKKGETYDDIINRVLDYPCTTCDNSGKHGPKDSARCSNCERWNRFITAQ